MLQITTRLLILKLKTFRLFSLIVENFHVTQREARDIRLEKVRFEEPVVAILSSPRPFEIRS